MKIFSHPLDSSALHAEFYAAARGRNLGAFISFAGIIRAELNEAGEQVEGLSFDIEPALLANWLAEYRAKETSEIAYFFAHAKGDVMAGECSYFAAVAARKREAALREISAFVEDFKRRAPIWKYDIVGGKRVYAAARSFALPHAGLLA